jgi:tRNA-dihydrouridine synthase B
MTEIFKNTVLPAPLAGITNEPFRILLKSLGYKITWTEMVSAEGIVRNQQKTFESVRLQKEEPITVVQLFGYKPETLYQAAKIISEEFGYAYMDINMGCPAKKIIRKKSGVKLMESPETVAKIFALLRKLPVKLSAKLRLGTSKENINFLEIVNILYNEGIDAIILHPRTGDQFFKGKAEWEYIKKVKDTFPNLFVIGNGDITSKKDVEKMRESTNCDAVMVGREIAKNPFFQFGETVSLEKKLKLFKTMFHNLLDFYNEQRAINLAKKYFILFTKGFHNSAKMRNSIIKIKNSVEFFHKISYWEENH